jgi:hypothetical protein
MNVPVWASDAAAAFWTIARGPEPFPRKLRRPILRSPLMLTVKDVPGLCVRGVERYLVGLGVVWSCGEPDRPLRACLAACDGAAIVFVDSTDDPPDRVFSLAHELAHFLRHYWGPRCLACRHLGVRAADLFDGKQRPTPAERVRALLADVPIGFHAHLMQRGPSRLPVSAAAAAAEEDADRLAYELLAPAAEVATLAGRVEGDDDPARVVEILRDFFGLPAVRAEEYGRQLLPPLTEDPLLPRLRKKS